jgi:hypothetical protein
LGYGYLGVYLDTAKYGVWGQTSPAVYGVPNVGYGVRPRRIDIVYRIYGRQALEAALPTHYGLANFLNSELPEDFARLLLNSGDLFAVGLSKNLLRGGNLGWVKLLLTSPDGGCLPGFMARRNVPLGSPFGAA